jgi:hypothetical protein
MANFLLESRLFAKLKRICASPALASFPMGNEVDELSDGAMAATKLAELTHQPEHHQDAANKHFAAAHCAQQSSRPSLAQHHLQQAAVHGAKADPTTPAGKAEAAHRATAKARQSNGAADHKTAADVHGDAAQAFGDAGNLRDQNKHDRMANDHQMAVHRIQNPPSRPPQYG